MHTIFDIAISALLVRRALTIREERAKLAVSPHRASEASSERCEPASRDRASEASSERCEPAPRDRATRRTARCTGTLALYPSVLQFVSPIQ